MKLNFPSFSEGLSMRPLLMLVSVAYVIVCNMMQDLPSFLKRKYVEARLNHTLSGEIPPLRS